MENTKITKPRFNDTSEMINISDLQFNLIQENNPFKDFLQK